jgi:hypothetical protein
MQQMMELLLKEMRAWGEKIDAKTRTTKAKTEAIKARTRAMRKKMGASHMDMVSAFKPEIEEETMACREMTEARPEEEKMLTLVNMKPEMVEQQEVPVEDAEVMPVGEPKKKRRRDRKLAAERRRQKPKTSTLESCGHPKELAVTCKRTTRLVKVARKTPIDWKMSHRATVAQRKRDIVKLYLPQEKCHPQRELVTSRTRTTHHAGVARQMENAIGKVRAKDSLVQRTQKGWTPRWRQLIRQEGTKEATNRDFADKLRLGSKWTLWRGRPPPKRKKGNGPYGRNRW